MFITLTAFTLVSGLSLDMRRNSYLASINVNNVFVAESPICINQNDYKITDFLVNKSNLIQKAIAKYLQEEKVQNDVQLNTYRIIEKLSELFIDNLDLDSIYISKYGTVLIDFEKENNLFSIEVGSKSIGYFSEIYSKTNNFCQEAFIDTEDALVATIGQLNTDFRDFYGRI